MTLLTATLPDKGKLAQMLADLIAERAFFVGQVSNLPGQSKMKSAGQVENLPHVPRTKSQFHDRVRAAKLRIPAAVQEVIETMGPLVVTYTEARRAVGGCRLPFAQTAIADCREQLARLTETGFLTTTSWDWLQQFPRYVPCAVRILSFYLEQFRSAVGASVHIAVNGGYQIGRAHV